jgi:hypothetical protein
MKTLIIIGGFLWLGYFVFHIFFWKLFNWKHELDKLHDVNKAIMQVMNLCLMLVFLVFAYISIFHSDELLTTGLGKSLLIGIVLFGIFRAIGQVVFFDMKPHLSKLFLLITIINPSC